jgi:large subunit ribosomal protein L22
MEVIARSQFIRRGPRKARLVADMVRGMRVEEALSALQFAPQHAAHDVAKTIRSAAANAEHNFELSRDELWLKTVMIDDGPTMKRIRPVSRGSAHQYFHRTCHITVVVEDREEESTRRRRPQAARRPVETVPADSSVDEQELAAAPDELEDETPKAEVATSPEETAEPEAEAVPTDTQIEVPGEAEGDEDEDQDDGPSPDQEPQGGAPQGEQ